MVTIQKQDGAFHFNVVGMHKLWAFKSQLIIPINHVVNAHQDHANIEKWKGWRMPGTYLPGVITAGTYYNKGQKVFWDVCKMKNSIIVELKDEDYNQLVIEVENPSEALKILNG